MRANSLWKIVADVLNPGSPEFNSSLAQLDDNQARLMRRLQFLEEPATRSLISSTDAAASFGDR